jgi:hypothetical protein
MLHPAKATHKQLSVLGAGSLHVAAAMRKQIKCTRKWHCAVMSTPEDKADRSTPEPRSGTQIDTSFQHLLII